MGTDLPPALSLSLAGVIKKENSPMISDAYGSAAIKLRLKS
jgi:hypothetical protein